MKNNLGRKKTTLLVVVIIAVIFVIGYMVSDHAGSKAEDAKPTASQEETMKPISESKEKSSANTISESPENDGDSALTTPSTDPTTVSEEGASANEQKVLDRALAYLNYSAYSYSGLVNQLINEGYTQEEADYGASHSKADWSKQAAKKAQEYIDSASYSRQELIDQLLYDGFTKDEADYGVAAVGY